MPGRKITPGYIFFLVLFWPDTWRILISAAVAFLLVPRIIPSDLSTAGSGLFYVMLATIGYSVAAAPARGISRFLRKMILGDRLPRE